MNTESIQKPTVEVFMSTPAGMVSLEKSGNPNNKQDPKVGIFSLRFLTYRHPGGNDRGSQLRNSFSSPKFTNMGREKYPEKTTEAEVNLNSKTTNTRTRKPPGTGVRRAMRVIDPPSSSFYNSCFLTRTNLMASTAGLV